MPKHSNPSGHAPAPPSSSQPDNPPLNQEPKPLPRLYIKLFPKPPITTPPTTHNPPTSQTPATQTSNTKPSNDLSNPPTTHNPPTAQLPATQTPTSKPSNSLSSRHRTYSKDKQVKPLTSNPDAVLESSIRKSKKMNDLSKAIGMSYVKDYIRLAEKFLREEITKKEFDAEARKLHGVDESVPGLREAVKKRVLEFTRGWMGMGDAERGER